jgi:hypothetical protein
MGHVAGCGDCVAISDLVIIQHCITFDVVR